MPTDQPCIFCRIIKGEVPSYKIYEDDKYLAFLDISQFTRGHTVVVPKDHVEFIWDYPDVPQYLSSVAKIANHYRSLGYQYVDSMTFGRKVPHAHIHLIPHHGDNEDYKQALAKLGEMQGDSSRRPTPEIAAQIIAEFKLPS